MDSDRHINAVAQGSKQVRTEMKGEVATGADFVKIELLYAIEGLKKAIVVYHQSKKDPTMQENHSENDLCCTRCHAKVNHRDEVECYDFNGRVAMCRQCADRPAKSIADTLTDIEPFLNWCKPKWTWLPRFPDRYPVCIWIPE